MEIQKTGSLFQQEKSRTVENRTFFMEGNPAAFSVSGDRNDRLRRQEKAERFSAWEG